MELDKITKEKERNPGDEGPSGQMLKPKAEEEEEQDIYSKLENPTEDIYVEAGKQRSGTPCTCCERNSEMSGCIKYGDVTGLCWRDQGVKGGKWRREKRTKRRSRSTALNYDADAEYKANKKVSPESKLTVDLDEEKGNQTLGNLRLYRAACVFLSIICLVLLLVSIVLSMKLAAGDGEMCSSDKCQTRFTNPPVIGCHRCAEGWVAFGNSCFYLSKHKLSWEESHRNCTARGGDLAVISNRHIQTFLTEKGNVMYWIGLKYRGNQWTWVNNTALVDGYWGTGRRGAKECALLSGGQPYQDNWIKESCSSQTYYICQLQP